MAMMNAQLQTDDHAAALLAAQRGNRTSAVSPGGADSRRSQDSSDPLLMAAVQQAEKKREPPGDARALPRQVSFDLADQESAETAAVRERRNKRKEKAEKLKETKRHPETKQVSRELLYHQRLQEMLKINPTLQQKELDRLLQLEVEEQLRRERFDDWLATEQSKIPGLPYSRRRMRQLELDQVEIDENTRRKTWEKQREEREAKYLMNRPDASKDLEAYLAEEAEKERKALEEKLLLEQQTRRMVGEGKVRQFASIFEGGRSSAPGYSR
jgi:hypothetical protein